MVPDTSYSISDSTITLVLEHKDVGIIVMPNLSFSAHLRQFSQGILIFGLTEKNTSSP